MKKNLLYVAIILIILISVSSLVYFHSKSKSSNESSYGSSPTVSIENPTTTNQVQPEKQIEHKDFSDDRLLEDELTRGDLLILNQHNYVIVSREDLSNKYHPILKFLLISKQNFNRELLLKTNQKLIQALNFKPTDKVKAIVNTHGKIKYLEIISGLKYVTKYLLNEHNEYNKIQEYIIPEYKLSTINLHFKTSSLELEDYLKRTQLFNYSDIGKIVSLIKEQGSLDINAIKVVVTKEYVNNEVVSDYIINTNAIKLYTDYKTYSYIKYKNEWYSLTNGLQPKTNDIVSSKPTNLSFLPNPLNKSSFRVSSEFNPQRKHPITGRIQPHNGIDLATPTGTKVYSVANGTVITNGYQKGKAGIYITIKHEGLFSHFKTYYMHLSKTLVKAGDYVKRGQVIALSGNTGGSTAPHLHFEIRENNIPFNPRLIDKKVSGLLKSNNTNVTSSGSSDNSYINPLVDNDLSYLNYYNLIVKLLAMN